MAKLLDAVHATSALTTHVHFAVDDDDPALPEYRKVMRAARDGDVLETGPRDGLTGWTNRVAVRRASEYRFLASLGDDMTPRTSGWDARLVRAIEQLGGTGFAYPFDGIREDIPEAVVMSSDIVTALGWMANPVLAHFWIDNTWADLGRGAGCIRYLRAVAVDHNHHVTGRTRLDATYASASQRVPADKAAYEKWRAEQMPADVALIRALRENARQPA